MTKLIAAVMLIAALSLNGCGGKSLPPVDTPKKTLATVDTGFQPLLRASLAYVTLPRCGTAGATAACSRQDWAEEINKAVHDVSDLLDQGWGLVRSPTFNEADGKLDALILRADDAVTTLSIILARHGIMTTSELSPDRLQRPPMRLAA